MSGHRLFKSLTNVGHREQLQGTGYIGQESYI